MGRARQRRGEHAWPSLEETIDRRAPQLARAGSPASRPSGSRWRRSSPSSCMSLASDVFATQQNLFNVTRNFAFVAIIAHRHDGGHHHRRHRPVGRRGARAVGHGHRHDDERRHVDLAGGAAGARRGAAGRRVQRLSDRLCRRAAVRRHAGHAVDRAQPGDGAVEQPHGLRVRARPAAAADARRRLRRPAAALRRRRSGCRARCSFLRRAAA